MPLPLAAHHWTDVGPRRRFLVDSDEFVGGERFRFPLRLYWRNRLDIDRAAYQPKRLFTEQDLAGLGSLLESGSDVDGVAGGEPFFGPRDDLARIDACPEL
jgi:hypothetical protein